MNPQQIRIPVLSPSSNSHEPAETSINGMLYGSGRRAVIFSNMDTNSQSEWNPVVPVLVSNGYMAITYDYPQHQDDQSEILRRVLSFAQAKGAEEIILIGASRGGVTSLKVAADPDPNKSITGIAAISAPMEYEGTVFYSIEELRRIRIPKLLINSEHDDGAGDTRKMYNQVDKPKEMQIYSGDAHGTELFAQHGDALLQKLNEFAVSLFSG